ncbi:histidine kinase [Rhodococcus sp. IEGM 1354]|uniref:sensor histidine kinase n=1 Tax=Rhodococcus sp. IEGM 1354 TaxID=3047088 RepID=UPI0024B793E5|nr:ATP-binding protein [Rhodococcus sp. IEGM 1354]MDI9930795.1 histidine kinase [Rhodococcus sp. IEGM 1354]
MTSDTALRDRLVTLILRPSAPPVACGIAVAAAAIAVEILVVLTLKRVSPENAFGAVFLFGVLIVSAGWGFRLSIATSVASAGAYAYIHVLESSESLVPALVVFLALALLTNVLVGQSRLRATESGQRRREADMLAAFAKTILRSDHTPTMLDVASTRLAAVLDLPFAVLKQGNADASAGQGKILLRDGDVVTASLLVPADLDTVDARRIRRVVPSLEALLAAARDRQDMHLRTVALARQQASLRKVATLVALRADPDDVYLAVAHELTVGLDNEHVSVIRYGDGCYTILAIRDDSAGERVQAGHRLPIGGQNVATIVADTGRAAAVDFTEATGGIAERLEGRGIRWVEGVPITVDGNTWGAVIIGTTAPRYAAGGETRDRLADFADLVATAVYNHDTRVQLTRSRSRVVAAADQARRGIERDLHDGAQQRIVSLGMELRGAQAAAPEHLTELRAMLDRSVETLSQVHTDLRELSRGIHPAILSRGGLAPALKTLARRSPIPVALTADISSRMDETVEVAAYYVVAEALTNTAKYAEATEVEITAHLSENGLELAVTDNGCGGADPSTGSGLIGLQDRVAAVGGELTIVSPSGGGTTLSVHIGLSTG